MSTQSTMTNLDTDHSGLVMAVAAMNVTNSSTTALPSSCTEQMVMGSGGLDSGYASQSSTPDTSKVTFVDRGVVSGRNIWAHAFRKTKELRPYNKPIPQLTHERFSDLRELYADSLNEFTRNLPNCRGVLMSLQVLGENEATAEPWVFVQCDKAIFKRVSNFFKQPFVKIEFEPPKPTDLSPRLRVIVCPLKLRQLAKYTALSSQHNPLALSDIIQIFGDQDGISSGTLCGTQVMNGISHGLRKATMGGVIVVADKKGEVKLFGMTAGHFLLQESYEESQDEVSDDLEDDFYIEEEAFELDLSSFDANIEEEEILPHEGAEDKCDDKAALLGWSKIGELSVASHTYLEDERNLDWALTTIDEQSVSLPNIIMSYYELKQCKFNGLEKGVIMVSARGPVWGTLSKSWSYMMLSPGKILVRTYLLTLSNNASLQSGDSGAWVVDEDTNEAYGHVVASDVFGRGYVVPICDSFEDIKNRLSAELVSLPSKADVLTFNQHHYQLEPAFNGMYQPDLPPGQCFPTRGRQDFLEEFSPDDLPRFYNSSNYNSQVWGDRQSSIPYGSSPDIYLQYSPASHIQPSSLYKLPDSGYSTMNNSPGQSPQPTSGAGGIAIQPGPRFGDRRAVAFDRLDHNIDPNASQFPVSRTRQRSQSLTGKLVNPESDPTKGLRVQQFKATVETVGAAHKGAK